MKLPASLLALTTLSAFAGAPEAKINMIEEPQTRPYLDVESAYGFEGDYERGGSGSVWEVGASAGVIIPWSHATLPGHDLGHWQWRFGVNYHRFEFDHDSPLPLPDRLQGLSAVIALELRVTDQLGALLDIRPGVYFEDDISDQAFDCPIRFGFGYRVSDRFSLVAMARYRGFAENPVIGGLGFVWNISDRLKLSAIYPEPRLTWRASEELSVWLGGEWAGGIYRTDHARSRGRLAGSVVDYTDVRAALGATWRARDWNIEVAGGVSFEREWDYHRANERFETDELAPFVKLSARREW